MSEEKEIMQPNENIQAAADLFSQLSPAAQDAIIDLIKSLLSEQ